MPDQTNPNSAASTPTLRAALLQRGIQLDDQQLAQLDAYARQLWEWNRKLNLTRHTSYERFVGRDVVDAQAVADLLATGERVLDLGTGGGVPGVVIAILRPDVEVALCDSVGKKARAVEDIVRAIGLDVPVYSARVQDLLEEHDFDTVVARAVGPLVKVLSWLQPHWGRFNRALFIKGPKWSDERHEARERGLLRDLSLRRLAHYPLEGTESESVILEVRPKAEVSD